MKLSAVIATANRAVHLAEAFSTFLSQSRLFDEIVIVDASSDDATKNLCTNWLSRLPLVYIPCQIMSAAVQRDIGIKASNGDIVYFLDDDVLLEDHYVEEIARLFENDPEQAIGGVSGTIINQTYGKPGWITRQYLYFMAGEYSFSYAGRVIGPGINLLPEDEGPDIKQVEWMPSGACAYLKTALNAVGGFGDFFKAYSMCEDVYLSTRVAQKWKLMNTRKARLFHKDLGGKTHKNWREIGKMSVINRWMVVRDVLHKDTLLNKFKLGISLLYDWSSALRNVIRGREHFRTAIDRLLGQTTGYISVLRNNGLVSGRKSET